MITITQQIQITPPHRGIELTGLLSLSLSFSTDYDARHIHAHIHTQSRYIAPWEAPANTVTTCLASAETRRALPYLLSCCWRCLSMPLPKDTVTLPHMSILNITAVWRLSLRTLRPAHLLSLQFVKMLQCPSLRSLTRSSVMTSPGLSALNPSPWSRTRSACTATDPRLWTLQPSLSPYYLLLPVLLRW